MFTLYPEEDHIEQAIMILDDLKFKINLDNCEFILNYISNLKRYIKILNYKIDIDDECMINLINNDIKILMEGMDKNDS